MTTIWTAHEAAKATGGKANGHWQASSITIDSRMAQPGDLFIALKGEHTDGHAFVKEVLQKGAAAMVTHIPEDIPPTAPLLIVRDCMQALEDLAAFNRRRSQARIVAITGSVGKTSTKEALRYALGGCGTVYASSGNFNNHLGVPISLARMPLGTDFGVFELGMNHAGEITPLSYQVRPSVAIITTVEAVHLEFFPSVQAIADAKAEIFLGMDPDGAAILNKDNPYFDHLSNAASQAGIKHIISFGTSDDSQCQLVEYTADTAGCHIKASIMGEEISYYLQATGIHHALNTVAALAAVYALGEDIHKSATALAMFGTPEGRGNLLNITINDKHFTLIDDSYNASPASMKAALDVLGNTTGRKLAILGDMRELGETAPQLHQGLFEAVTTNNIDVLITVGQDIKHLYDALPCEKQAGHYPDIASLFPHILTKIQNNDILLIKGSHGVEMFKLVAFLKNHANKEPITITKGNTCDAL